MFKRSLSLGTWNLELETSQPNYLRATLAPQFTIECVSGVNNERGEFRHSLVVDLRVIRHNDDAITSEQLFIRQGDGLKWLIAALRVRVREANFRDERIVIADTCSLSSQQINDRKRRTLAHVVDVLLISHAQKQHSRPLQRLLRLVQSVRNQLHDVL